MNIKWILLLFFIFYILAACKTDGASCQDFYSQGDNAPVVKHGDWDQIYSSTFYLCNCIWGKGELTDYNNFIYDVSRNKVFPVGWKWDWPRANTDQVKAYPSISFGRNPWSDRSTMPGLPRRIDQIREAVVTYDITHCVEGKYNLSFDLWITRTAGKTNPPETNIVREVMIWQDYKGRNMIHQDKFVQRVTIDGEVYKFYAVIDMVTMSGTGLDFTRDYMCFIKETPEYQGETKIHEFLTFLVEHNYIQPNEYLRNIDLGNEIWYGSGETILNDFSLVIK